MKKIIFLIALLATITTLSTNSMIIFHDIIPSQNVPRALYPEHLTVYKDHAWYGITSWDKQTIKSYCKLLYGKDTTFCKNLITTINRESGFNQDAISETGARGLMQIFPAASFDMGYKYNKVIKYPWININCGAKYLKFCLKKAKNDYELAYKFYVNGPWHLLACNKKEK